jgi:hypothetical protein
MTALPLHRGSWYFACMNRRLGGQTDSVSPKGSKLERGGAGFSVLNPFLEPASEPPEACARRGAIEEARRFDP